MSGCCNSDPRRTSFMWLELTGACQLECVHCYAGSSPQGNHGTMGEADWLHVIDQGADNGLEKLQFIGGEPTAHPAFVVLLNHALGRGIQVEVYSNLFVLMPKVLDALRQPGVMVATSYYSASATVHDAVTTKRGSHARTRSNIIKLVELGVPLRVGLVEMPNGNETAATIDDLVSIGVDRQQISSDRVREIGRGGKQTQASLDELCGQCGLSSAVVLPDGNVYPCVFSRWMEPVGNVLLQPLTEIVNGQPLQQVRDTVNGHFFNLTSKEISQLPGGSRSDQLVRVGGPQGLCDPIYCDPNIKCKPTGGTCNPDYGR